MAIRTFNSVGGFSVGETPTTIILANGDITTANGTFTANVGALNVKTDNLLYANGVPWDFQQAAGTGNYQIQYNNNNDFGASANFTFDPTTNLLNLSNGNANVSGNITASNFLGNFAGNIIGNITAAGVNTQVQFNDGGNLGNSSAFTFDKTTNTLSVTNLSSNVATANFFTGTLTTNAQPNITSVGVLSSLSISGTGSVSGGNLVSANFLTGTLTTALQPNITQVGTLGDLSVIGNAIVGNLTGANVVVGNFLTGTLTTGAQPNITSLGNLSSIRVTGNGNIEGNLNAANLSVTGKVITSLVPGPDNTLSLGNSGNVWNSLFVSNINIGTTFIRSSANVILMDAANIGNNLSTGTLTVRNDGAVQGNLTVTGNLTVAGNTTYINVQNLDIADPLISMGGSGNGGNATAYDGKDRGMVLLNYYSNGSGPVNQAVIWKQANSEFQMISQVNNITNEVVTASAFGNLRADTFIGNLSGYVTQGNQYLITTVGTLGNLTISGNLRVNTTANVNSLIASGLSYPTGDGSTSQVLSTHGNGQLYWATISTSSLSNGNSNITVLQNGNVTISSNGVANIVNIDGVSANPTVRITGNANISGTVNAGNTTVANLLIGNSTLRSATVTTTATTANQTIVGIPYSGIRGAIFDIKGEQALGGRYSIATVYAVHDGTNVEYTVSGTVLIGGATGTLAAQIVGSTLFLTVTPTSSNSTVWTTQYRTI
jgi:cytoskeletal protein CcmA (bactofilin family)